jgi:hypothetical protein
MTPPVQEVGQEGVVSTLLERLVRCCSEGEEEGEEYHCDRYTNFIKNIK